MLFSEGGGFFAQTDDRKDGVTYEWPIFTECLKPIMNWSVQSIIYVVIKSFYFIAPYTDTGNRGDTPGMVV